MIIKYYFNGIRVHHLFRAFPELASFRSSRETVGHRTALVPSTSVSGDGRKGPAWLILIEFSAMFAPTEAMNKGWEEL